MHKPFNFRWLATILLSIAPYAFAQQQPGISTEELQRFANAYAAIKAAYADEVTDKQLINASINGMVSKMDVDSAYLNAEDFADIQANAKNDLGGIGLELGMRKGKPTVVSAIENTPAFFSGLQAGDVIVAIDGRSTGSNSLADTVKMLRGKPGSEVAISVERGANSESLIFKIKRERIKIASVQSKLIEPGLAYLRVSNFNEDASVEMTKRLLAFSQQEPLYGVVLDLRNCPGGLLNIAVAISAMFLPEKVTVMTTRGRADDSNRSYSSVPSDYLRGSREDIQKTLPQSIKTVPLVVLVNSTTAAGSEIVAAALQDYKRATIVGSKTFGRSSIQTMLPVTPKTALKLTTAHWYSPLGRSVSPNGLMPDVVVADEKKAEFASKDDSQFNQAVALLKKQQ
jgi:carboxyl-terminal processing protease